MYLTGPLAVAILIVAGVWCWASAAGAAAGVPGAPPAAAVQPFDLSAVRLAEGPLKTMQDLDRRYLMELNADRLLHNFRASAKLPSSAKPYGGWEAPNCELRGHFVGHYLSACALMYAATGDEKVKARADAMVAELAKCQKALGGEYLSAYPEEFFDRVETGKPVWAPYYTIHKIMAGMRDMYLYCGNKEALEVLKGMAAWAAGRNGKLSDEQMARVLKVEFGGMNDVLCDVYAITRDPAHLAAAHRFDQASLFDPLAEGRDVLTGIHANTQVPKFIGAARRYELAGETRYRDIARFAWECIVNGRTYATGGTSNGEFWGKPRELARTLSHANQETCVTHNMLKLTRHLIAWTAAPGYADYYERAFWNGILGTQDPQDGSMTYFVPLASGYYKLFNTPEDSFWCCTGTGVESFAKLGDSIYWHGEKGLYINLFIASDLAWAAKGVRVEQRTHFPEEEGTTLVIRAEKPVELAVNIRVPEWAVQGIEAKINGRRSASDADPRSYLRINREWKDGDRIELRMPMSLRTEAMPDDPSLKAVMYGPLVLVGLLGSEGLTEKMSHTNNQGAYAPPVRAPVLVVESDDVRTWVEPVEGKPLTFRTTGQPQDITFEPYYRMFGQRYGVYWRVFKKGSPEYKAYLDAEAAREAAEKVRRERRVDEVTIMDRQSERTHNLKGDKTSAGEHMGRAWRHAPDGWFSYDLKVLGDQPMTLACTYWGGDAGGRTFDVLVDGQKIATQVLNNNDPGKFFGVEYAIPPELTKDKSLVTVKFQAHKDNTAGGVFGCAILKPKK